LPAHGCAGARRWCIRILRVRWFWRLRFRSTITRCRFGGFLWK
jgi:hypothetical protein